MNQRYFAPAERNKANTMFASTSSGSTGPGILRSPFANSDANADTESDPEWLPLINTPAHPEYPAGHPSLNGAAATILARQFDERPQHFTLTTGTQPSRTYSSIEQARDDANHARIWGGMHYPSTVRISDDMGAAIAAYVDGHAMLRLHHR